MPTLPARTHSAPMRLPQNQTFYSLLFAVVWPSPAFMVLCIGVRWLRWYDSMIDTPSQRLFSFRMARCGRVSCALRLLILFIHPFIWHFNRRKLFIHPALTLSLSLFSFKLICLPLLFLFSLFRRMGCLGSKDRLTKEDMEFLKSHTRYDEVTIKEWYKGFKVSREAFANDAISLTAHPCPFRMQKQLRWKRKCS